MALPPANRHCLAAKPCVEHRLGFVGREGSSVCSPDMGDKIAIGHDGKLDVSDNPIIPFIEGDGTGVDI